MTITAPEKENAGGNRRSVSNPQVKEANNMTLSEALAERTTPERVDHEFTTFRTDRELSILEIADSERFADFEIEVEQYDKRGPVYFEDHDDYADVLYRFCGWIRVVPARKVFRIFLRPEAVIGDQVFFLGVVEKIRSGHFNNYPWNEHPSSSPGSSNTFFEVELGRPVLRFQPRGKDVMSYELFVCTRAGCESCGGFHAERDREDIVHVFAESWDGPDDNDWSITIRGYGEDPWQLDLSVEELSPEQAARFAQDLRWAAGEAAKLNGEGGHAE